MPVSMHHMLVVAAAAAAAAAAVSCCKGRAVPGSPRFPVRFVGGTHDRNRGTITRYCGTDNRNKGGGLASISRKIARFVNRRLDFSASDSSAGTLPSPAATTCSFQYLLANIGTNSAAVCTRTRLDRVGG